jgi:hypothetical protein
MRDPRVQIAQISAELTSEPSGKSCVSGRVRISSPLICASEHSAMSSMRCSMRTGCA